MTAPDRVLPDADTDPTRFVLAAAERCRRMGTHGYGFDTAHGRFYVGVADLLVDVAERHCQEAHQTPQWCGWCTMTWPCPDLLGAVDAAKAYLGWLPVWVKQLDVFARLLLGEEETP